MPVIKEYISSESETNEPEPESTVNEIFTFESPCENLIDDFIFMNMNDKNKDNFIFFSDKCILLLSYNHKDNKILVEKIMNHKLLSELNEEKYKKIMSLKDTYFSIDDNPSNINTSKN